MEEIAMEKVAQEAAVFAALSDPTRLGLMKILCRCERGNALCVSALAMNLNVTQPAISQHLRVLKIAGLVKSERRGYHIHYFIEPEALKKCQETVLDMLNQADINARAPCQKECKNRRK